MTELPMLLVPLFLVPLYLLSHLAIFARLLRRSAPSTEHAVVTAA
jgi:hypothetical protein